MNLKFDRITMNPEILNGQPCIRRMRLTVRRVVEAVAIYPDREELKKEYPELTDEDIRQAYWSLPHAIWMMKSSLGVLLDTSVT